ncbi:MAG: cytochrome c oxidase subunit 2 [Cocleimonas sp.]|jgi:cytochrome c oxidase subunit 2
MPKNTFYKQLTSFVISLLNRVSNLHKVYLLPLLFTPQLALAELGLNLPEGVTPISRDIYSLHMTIFWVCVVIAILVFGAMVYSMIFHRKSKGAVAANFHENTKVELAWTIIPLIVLIVIAIPATKVMVDLETTNEADMTVKITGYQWKWQYEYLDNDVSFFSSLSENNRKEMADPVARANAENYLLEVDNPLVLPVGKKIRFLMTSNDVIHSWWMRDFGVKQDANPGYINDAWATIEKPGTYRGQCTELCGKDHGFMPVVVIAKPQAEYDAWVVEQEAKQIAIAEAASGTKTKEELMVQGQKIYSSNCAACHGATGAGVPGVFPAITGSSIVNNPDTAAHINILLNGVAGSAMQAFGKQLNDGDIASVITYQRNALGNSEGTVVQPSDIKAAR